MDITGSIDRLVDPLARHGYVLGAGVAVATNLGGIVEDLAQLLQGHAHMPEWGNFLASVNSDPVFINSILIALAGYFFKDMTSNRLVHALGELAEKGGLGFLLTKSIVNLVYFSTHSPDLSGNDQSNQASNTGYAIISKGSTLGQPVGGQMLAPYQTVYPTNPTAGTLYTVTSGSRLMGN